MMVQRVVKYSPPGFAPMLEGQSAPLPFASLPQIETTNIVIYAGEEDTAEWNDQAYIHYFDGKFWAYWTTGESDLDLSQSVVFSTSADAITWTAPAYVHETAPGRSARGAGVWNKDGTHYFLYVEDEASSGYSEDLILAAKPYLGSSTFGSQIEIVANATPVTLPLEVEPGVWLIVGRNIDETADFLRGDIGAWTRTAMNEGGLNCDEPLLLPITPGLLGVVSRDGSASRRALARTFSRDAGVTWEPLRTTNYPDAISKSAVLSLSNGRFVLVNNTDRGILGVSDTASRNPLTLSVSDDGLVFTNVSILRGDAATYAYPKNDGGYSKIEGWQYPFMMEREGFLYVIYSRNKEAIHLSIIDIDDLP